MISVTAPFPLDHAAWLNSLCATDNLLLIQDLDGVCMGLVRDPLTRILDPRYIEAAQQLDGQFYVLTNGEHIGSRGVNAIVERAFDTPEYPAEHGLYLPGLAAGGVQLQDRHGRVTHPGVSDAELRFLEALPARFAAYLDDRLAILSPALSSEERNALTRACVLDNRVSPTLNINACYARLAKNPEVYVQLQHELERYMCSLLDDAASSGLHDAFFIHYAPNLGRDEQGNERLRPGTADDAGTTDFQFMLDGAIKEVGVLVILNHYYHARTGHYPLGEQFNARQAPRDLPALLTLARERLDPVHMPRILAVGDTVTSQIDASDPSRAPLRGGSDRGFLTLVQQLGEAFQTDNVVAYIDSSRDEVRRPGIDADHLRACQIDASLTPWPALNGISDPSDPLRLDVIFDGGYRQYRAFFEALAECRCHRSAPLHSPTYE